MKTSRPLPPSDEARIEESLVTKSSKLFAAKRLSKWFEIDVTIKMFGVTVFSWHFPPQKVPSEPDTE